MPSILQKITLKADQLSRYSWFTPVFFYLVTLIAYGMFIPWLGFYGDDWSYIWLGYKFNNVSLFFQNNRNLLTYFYQAIMPILGPHPIFWHLFMLSLRWLSGYLFYLLLKRLFPANKKLNLWISLAFLLYPGFLLQYEAVTFCLLFSLLNALLGSFLVSIRQMESRQMYFRWLPIGLILTAFNLLFTEYFYFLELFRLVIFWHLQDKISSTRSRLRQAFKFNLPYLLLFIATLIWRIFSQQTITRQYRMELLNDLVSQPFITIVDLSKQIGLDLWHTTLGAWWRVVDPPERLLLFGPVNIAHWTAAISVAIVFILLLIWVGKKHTPSTSNAVRLIVYGLIAFGLGGMPIWLAKLELTRDYGTTRWYTPFMLGSCLILGGIVSFIPRKKHIQSIIMGMSLGLAIGMHLLMGNVFRQDWNLQKDFFWQISWRMPDIKPGTILIADKIPTIFGEENSISAGLNYFFTRDDENPSVSKYVYFVPERIEYLLEKYPADQPLQIPHMIGNFESDQLQMVGIHLDDRNCIRIMDPQADWKNVEFPRLFKNISRASSTNWISNQGTLSNEQQASFFLPEPAHDWCWIYQQADLARQNKDWKSAARLADELLALKDEKINDLSKYWLLLESYANNSEWEKVVLVAESYIDQRPAARSSVCILLTRIQTEVEPSLIGTETLVGLNSKFRCESN